jgi:hypothetical protein
MQELLDVQKMLELKNKQLSQRYVSILSSFFKYRESELKTREKNYESLQKKSLQILQNEFAS